jgi:putative LysE/RhtB family amino acid efflux pump
VSVVLVRAFAIGLAVAMPVGSMAVLCVERTLARGWRSGMATGAGIATADGAYASVAAFGVTAVSAALVEWQPLLRLLGGLALLWIGYRAVRSTYDTPESRPSPPPGEDQADTGLAALYASALALTLTNPMTVLAFAAIFVSAGVVVADSARDALVITLGVAAGSLSWWIVLVSGTSLVRHGITPNARLWLTRVSGVAIAGFGVLSVASVAFG